MAKLLEPLPGRPLATVPLEHRRAAAARETAAAPVVREMRLGDGAPAFYAHGSSAWPRLGYLYVLKLPSEIVSADAIERDIAHEPADPRFWLVATALHPRRGESIVGFASGQYRIRLPDAARCLSVNVAVLPEWQGRGVARRLHDRVEAWALDRGVRRLTATVQAPNQAGRAFAMVLGYEPEVTMRSYSLIGGRMVDRLRVGKLFGG